MPEYTRDTQGTPLSLPASRLIASTLRQGLLLNMNVQYNGLWGVTIIWLVLNMKHYVFLYKRATYSCYFLPQYGRPVGLIPIMAASSISFPLRWRKECSWCASSFSLWGVQKSSDWCNINLKAEHCIHRTGITVIVLFRYQWTMMRN